MKKEEQPIPIREQPPLLKSIATTLKLGKTLVSQLENQSQEQPESEDELWEEVLNITIRKPFEFLKEAKKQFTIKRNKQ